MSNPYESPITESELAPEAQQQTLPPRLRTFLAAAMSFSIGFGLWLSARMLPGSDEPWDTSYPLYSGTMFVSGLVIGFVAPKRFFGPYVGVWSGQFVAIIALPWFGGIMWWPLALVSTGIGSLVMLPGLFVGWAFNVVLKRRT